MGWGVGGNLAYCTWVGSSETWQRSPRRSHTNDVPLRVVRLKDRLPLKISESGSPYKRIWFFRCPGVQLWRHTVSLSFASGIKMSWADHAERRGTRRMVSEGSPGFVGMGCLTWNGTISWPAWQGLQATSVGFLYLWYSRKDRNMCIYVAVWRKQGWDSWRNHLLIATWAELPVVPPQLTAYSQGTPLGPAILFRKGRNGGW